MKIKDRISKWYEKNHDVVIGMVAGAVAGGVMGYIGYSIGWSHGLNLRSESVSKLAANGYNLGMTTTELWIKEKVPEAYEMIAKYVEEHPDSVLDGMHVMPDLATGAVSVDLSGTTISKF